MEQDFSFGRVHGFCVGLTARMFASGEWTVCPNVRTNICTHEDPSWELDLRLI